LVPFSLHLLLAQGLINCMLCMWGSLSRTNSCLMSNKLGTYTNRSFRPTLPACTKTLNLGCCITIAWWVVLSFVVNLEISLKASWGFRSQDRDGSLHLRGEGHHLPGFTFRNFWGKMISNNESHRHQSFSQSISRMSS
jgi:hypothetical protein